MDWKPITELRSVTCHMGSQCYLPPDTALSPAMQAGTRFTYPGGMEGWVDLGVGYIPRWFTCPQTTSRSRVQRPNRYTTKPPIGIGLLAQGLLIGGTH